MPQMQRPLDLEELLASPVVNHVITLNTDYKPLLFLFLFVRRIIVKMTWLKE